MIANMRNIVGGVFGVLTRTRSCFIHRCVMRYQVLYTTRYMISAKMGEALF